MYAVVSSVSTSTCGISCVELPLVPLCFAASIPWAQTVETFPCGPWAIITFSNSS